MPLSWQIKHFYHCVILHMYLQAKYKFARAGQQFYLCTLIHVYNTMPTAIVRIYFLAYLANYNAINCKEDFSVYKACFENTRSKD